jgi:hypothetical protein
MLLLLARVSKGEKEKAVTNERSSGEYKPTVGELPVR